MRKSTALWLFLTALSAASLFYTGQNVHDDRETLTKLSREIGTEEESIRVLSAEWEYLNQPKRLEKLAREHLKLAPLKGSQFVHIDDIPFKSETIEEKPPTLIETVSKTPCDPGETALTGNGKCKPAAASKKPEARRDITSVIKSLEAAQ